MRLSVLPDGNTCGVLRFGVDPRYLEDPSEADQPHFTRRQNLALLAFMVVPSVLVCVVLGFVFRSYWPWIIAACILTLGNLAPAIRAEITRRQSRRANVD
jgi:hypothetical protein